MKYLYYIVLSVSIVIIGLIYLFVMNPYDKQYKSFYLEKEAAAALEKGDIDTYLELADSSVSKKYHSSQNLILSIIYKKIGRYDDAKEVISEFKKDYDYSYCTFYKDARFKYICRAYATLNPVKYDMDKHAKYAEIYFENEEYEKSLAEMIIGQTDQPCLRAKIFAARNIFPAAYKNLHYCKLQKSNNKEYILTKAYVLQKQKKYDKAKKYYYKSINKNCTNSEKCKGNNTSYLMLGKLFMEEKDYRSAIVYFKKVMQTENYNYKANYYTGICYKKLNEPKMAKYYFEQANKYNPDNSEQINKLISDIK